MSGFADVLGASVFLGKPEAVLCSQGCREINAAKAGRDPEVIP